MPPKNGKKRLESREPEIPLTAEQLAAADALKAEAEAQEAKATEERIRAEDEFLQLQASKTKIKRDDSFNIKKAALEKEAADAKQAADLMKISQDKAAQQDQAEKDAQIQKALEEAEQSKLQKLKEEAILILEEQRKNDEALAAKEKEDLVKAVQESQKSEEQRQRREADKKFAAEQIAKAQAEAQEFAKAQAEAQELAKTQAEAQKAETEKPTIDNANLINLDVNSPVKNPKEVNTKTPGRVFQDEENPSHSEDRFIIQTSIGPIDLEDLDEKATKNYMIAFKGSFTKLQNYYASRLYFKDAPIDSCYRFVKRCEQMMEKSDIFINYIKEYEVKLKITFNPGSFEILVWISETRSSKN